MMNYKAIKNFTQEQMNALIYCYVAKNKIGFKAWLEKENKDLSSAEINNIVSTYEGVHNSVSS